MILLDWGFDKSSGIIFRNVFCIRGGFWRCKIVRNSLDFNVGILGVNLTFDKVAKVDWDVGKKFDLTINVGNFKGEVFEGGALEFFAKRKFAFNAVEDGEHLLSYDGEFFIEAGDADGEEDIFLLAQEAFLLEAEKNFGYEKKGGGGEDCDGKEVEVVD